MKHTAKILATLIKKKIGYRTDHVRWCPLKEMKKFEIDLGNRWFDDHGKENWEVIWVCHSARDAERYGKHIKTVDLNGAEPLMTDDEGGYLYGRPR